jgi:DNA replication protein DnaC
MGEDDVRRAQERIDGARGYRSQDPRPTVQTSKGPQSLEDALGRFMAKLDDICVTPEQDAAYRASQAHRVREEQLRASGFEDVLRAEMWEAAAEGLLGADSHTSEALEVVRRWAVYQSGERARGSRPVLCLVGERGRGKTVAAAWLALAEGGRYVEAEELCRLYATKWGPDRERYQDLVGKRVLIVDEIGTEADPRTSVAAIHDVVNRRQGARKMTLLMGNMSKRQLVERYDARTIDRLREVGAVIEVQGESMRRGAL